MRTIARFAAGALLLAGLPAHAQSVAGRYVLATPEGNRVSLVVEDNGPGKVKGSLSGNGLSFALDGTFDGRTLSGTLRGSTGAAIIRASRTGAQLGVLLVELAPNGTPQLNTARQLAFSVDDAAASAPGSAPLSAPGSAPAQQGGADASASSVSQQDRQLAQLFVSSAWCTMSYSGSSTYNGGYGDRTTTKRAVFGQDGILRQSTNNEAYNSGANGRAYGNGSNVETYRWKTQGGALQLSSDGVQWQPVRIEVSRNSNGYPIIKADGVEYNQCR